MVSNIINMLSQPTVRQILKGSYTGSQRARYLLRFFKWQAMSKIFGQELVFRFTDHSKLKLMRGFNALSGNYYFGISDPDIMPFVLHFLRTGDLFADIGANGGAYTVLASAECQAHTIAIEAAADIFKGLQKNIAVNQIGGLVEAHNIAVSDKEGTLPFTSADHATNRVCFEDRPDIVQVQAKTLDNLLGGRIPILFKMDIEGHEHNALLGAARTIADEACRAIVIEFSNTGEYYGYGNHATHKLLTGYGFAPYVYESQTRQLTPIEPYKDGFRFNMIYVKDPVFVRSRLASSRRFNMSGITV